MEHKSNMANLLTLGRKMALCGFFLASLPAYAGNSPSGQDGTISPVLLLASQLAYKVDNPSAEFKNNVASLYAQTYGNLDTIPKSWQIVVRRALTCQIIGDQPCLRSSAALMISLGGVDTFKLEKLYEVSQFKANPDDLMKRLQEITNGTDTLNAANTSAQEIEAKPAADTVPSVRQVETKAETAATNVPFVKPNAEKVEQESKYINSIMIGILVLGFITILVVALRKKNDLYFTSKAPAPPVVEIDPKEASSRCLLETIHSTECDLDWIIEHASQTPGYQRLNESITNIESWRNSLREARSAMLAEFEHRNWDTTLAKVDAPESIEFAFTRLVNSAAFFCSLLHLQKKSDSMMYYWSKQIPHSLLKVFWSVKTTTTVAKLNDSPLLDVAAGKPPTFAVDLIQESESLFKNAIFHAAKS